LNGGVGLVPLAPLGDVEEESLPGLVQRMAARINALPRPRAAKLWTATYLLMGLRYSEEMAMHLLEGVASMQESTTYQAILREGREAGRNEGLNEGLIEGRVREAQRLLLLLGESRFGAPGEPDRSAVEAIQDLERLERLTKRVLDANIAVWEALLSTP